MPYGTANIHDRGDMVGVEVISPSGIPLGELFYQPGIRRTIMMQRADGFLRWCEHNSLDPRLLIDPEEQERRFIRELRLNAAYYNELRESEASQRRIAQVLRNGGLELEAENHSASANRYERDAVVYRDIITDLCNRNNATVSFSDGTVVFSPELQERIDAQERVQHESTPEEEVWDAESTHDPFFIADVDG